MASAHQAPATVENEAPAQPHLQTLGAPHGREKRSISSGALFFSCQLRHRPPTPRFLRHKASSAPPPWSGVPSIQLSNCESSTTGRKPWKSAGRCSASGSDDQ
jgi:hypothetical protein